MRIVYVSTPQRDHLCNQRLQFDYCQSEAGFALAIIYQSNNFPFMIMSHLHYILVYDEEVELVVFYRSMFGNVVRIQK